MTNTTTFLVSLLALLPQHVISSLNANQAG